MLFFILISLLTYLLKVGMKNNIAVKALATVLHFI